MTTGTVRIAIQPGMLIEAARILHVGACSVLRWDADTQLFTKIYGTHGQRSPLPDGSQVPPADCPEGTLVLQTGRPVRVDDWSDIPGLMAAGHRNRGFGQTVAAPIIVDGAIWGHIGAYGEADEVLPP